MVRASKDNALATLALLEIENEVEAERISDFREHQNQNRIAHLRETINEYHSDVEALSDAEDVGALKERLKLKSLNEELEGDLEDVALTDDQRQKLENGVDTGDWVDYGTPAASALLASLIHPLAGLATGIGVAALKNWFGNLDGDIEERMEKLTEELEEEGYLTGAGDRPDRVPSAEEV